MTDVLERGRERERERERGREGEKNRERETERERQRERERKQKFMDSILVPLFLLHVMVEEQHKDCCLGREVTCAAQWQKEPER